MCQQWTTAGTCANAQCQFEHIGGDSVSAVLIEDVQEGHRLPYCRAEIAGIPICVRMDSCCLGASGVIDEEVARRIIAMGDPSTTVIWKEGRVRQLKDGLQTKGTLCARVTFVDRDDPEKKIEFLHRFTIIEAVDRNPILGWGLIDNHVTHIKGTDYFDIEGVIVTKLVRRISAWENEWSKATTSEAVAAVSAVMGPDADESSIFGFSPISL